ncbi:hypothetical protein L208DRAFT_1557295, partial [Tricholoma matsutake]
EILDSKIDNHCRCKLLYFVWWEGYQGTDEETSWLPATELDHAQELVTDFHIPLNTLHLSNEILKKLLLENLKEKLRIPCPFPTPPYSLTPASSASPGSSPCTSNSSSSSPSSSSSSDSSDSWLHSGSNATRMSDIVSWMPITPLLITRSSRSSHISFFTPFTAPTNFLSNSITPSFSPSLGPACNTWPSHTTSSHLCFTFVQGSQA